MSSDVEDMPCKKLLFKEFMIPLAPSFAQVGASDEWSSTWDLAHTPDARCSSTFQRSANPASTWDAIDKRAEGGRRGLLKCCTWQQTLQRE
eukprot:5171232-Amphidinium_carterae.1